MPIPQQDPREPSSSGISSPEPSSSTPTTAASNAHFASINDDSARSKSRKRHSKMSGIKRRVQHYLGVEEAPAQSVHALDWFKSHKGDIKSDVSFDLESCEHGAESSSSARRSNRH